MFDIIIATDINFGIGNNNKIPWKCSDDLKIFKKKTDNSIIITGRKTAQYLPYLKNRIIYCISSTIRTGFFHPKGYNNSINVFSSFEDALKNAQNTGKKIFVAGGAELYNYVFSEHIKNIDIVHISTILNSYVCDTYLSQTSINILDTFSILCENKTKTFVHTELKYVEDGEEQYLNLVKDIINNGNKRKTRNYITLSCFTKHLKFDLRNGFPLLTTKKMFFKGIVEELLFFIRGETYSKILEEKNINIWKGNTSRKYLDSIGMLDRKEGIMGPMYGYQWRYFNAPYDEESGTPLLPGIDQLSMVINLLKNDKTSRRIMMTTYNPSQISQSVLPPCHSIVLQFYCEDIFLDTFCYNRSSDVGLGLPFNIASSALLISIIGKITGLIPRYFNLSLGDAHIYENHIVSLSEQVSRKKYTFPTICLPNINQIDDINTLSVNDFILNNYRHHEKINMEMIV